MKKIFTKKNIIQSLIVIFISLGISLCSLLAGSFNSSSVVETMVYSTKSERKADNVDFTYVEALSNTPTNLFNDSVSTFGVTFDNYWHFENRPNIYAFKKWDISTNPTTGEEVYPLSFDYSIFNETKRFEVPIISIIGNRWEGDLSHLELEVTDKNFSFNIDDTIAIQNSVIISQSLANKLSPSNPESLVGTTIKENVSYLNSYYKEAHYNNSSSSDVIDEVNIVAIFNDKSSKKMSRLVGEDFVFMYGGKEGTYNHCGLKIGCHLSTDDYANYVALSQFLTLENNKSTVRFYDYKDNNFVIGNLQNKYVASKNLSSSSWTVLGPSLAVLFLVGFLTLFWIFVYRKKTIMNTTMCIASFVFFALLFSLIKMFTFGNASIVVLNPIGCGLFLIISLVISIFMIRSKEKKAAKITTDKETVTNKKSVVMSILAHICLLLSMTSVYAVLSSLTQGNKYFLLPSLTMSIGMFLCMVTCQPVLNINRPKKLKPIVRKILLLLISFTIVSFHAILFILISSLIIPDINFSTSHIVLTLAISLIELVIVIIINNLKNNNRPSTIDVEYMEINV